MKDDAETTSPSAATLHAALLDYYSAPGKYQLTLRQPATLFASIREILQVAAGRGTPAGADAAHLRDAAMFFIRAALLYPGADHYAVMGYPAGADPSDLKERYRLLMRLTHPDFAEAGAAAWPPDAAVRVNRANEVLSSPVLRREYEEQLAALRQQRPAVSGKPASHMPAVIPRRPHAPRLQVGKRAAWILGVTLAGIAMLMLMPRQEPQHLVQRKPPAPVIPREILATPSAPPPVQAPPAAPAPAPEQPSALALLEADRLRPPVPPAAPPQ
ncbi:MAG TPA: DnaJ domain-containing protein, partial [Ramlibacter sp.]